MAREDQMEALYEFFGGTPDTYVTSPSAAFSDIKTVSRGEQLSVQLNQLPSVWISAPKSREYRQQAQFKYIDYALEAVLVAVEDGPAPESMATFYGWIDEVANKIRTNKQLITQSYPQGASIRFGEDFSVDEHHERDEQGVLYIARFQISSREMVQA